MINQFGQLYKMFIRPTRQEYNNQDLGNPYQIYGQYKSKREDIIILNKKGQKLQCSLFYPLLLSQSNDDFPLKKINCVIYCHCNSGSRLEPLRFLPQLISKGLALFCFDFSGSGLSEGEYVTLGKNESEDLDLIIQYLKNSEKVSNMILWGRSMGAVTCFQYLNKPGSMRNIKGVIFDSGFANLKFLAQDLAKQKTGMPSILIETALSFISEQIKQKCNLDIKSIDLTKNIHNLHIPCFFICSKEDTFIKCQHTEQLYNRYNGRKWLEYVNGNHNADRQPEFVEKISVWIFKLFEENLKNNNNIDQNLRKQQSFHMMSQSSISININNNLKRSQTPIYFKTGEKDNIETDKNIIFLVCNINKLMKKNFLLNNFNNIKKKIQLQRINSKITDQLLLIFNSFLKQ
ncbi:hypothetical protein IMG5_146530 [Ichthyophthirius multifiliis]|uniref:AB hydrolase-1 domain-containing protein n=1 Tax=Ichthyophthirius multifiliis TaxID=5932 RepID=G0QY11_ICHMU|nr:hypothetical protein IMG5_146530 [Ichthyophthirius multifiliis]EGR29880.1 hypothetical protein IMG5_146530 [Ichthyophthirius multifiliis]|eukprot:XP_004031116.1 hypothetical protein IMG5_146530 [Ichthyophthirius multifiliis]